jgi:hypothetical protein
MEALDCRDIGAFVESGFFDGSADQEASVATWDEICLVTADDVFKYRARRHQETEHLSFYGAGGKRVRPNLAGPRTGAVDDFRGVECGLDGCDARGAAIDYGYRSDFVAGREVNAAMPRCFPCGCGERSRIDATFFQMEGGTICLCQGWFEFRQGSG